MQPETPGSGAPLDRALHGLAGPVPPPARLEDRVVAELAARALLRTGGRRRHSRTLLAAAAAVMLFAAGAYTGAHRGAVAEGPRYALLLLDGPGYVAPPPGGETAAVERYREWAAGLRRDRALVLAEKLGATVAVLRGSDGGAAASVESGLLGVFVVIAPDDAGAVAIAAASPHVARGGRVAVVRIDPT
jgi:hypothetical protein